ncbi:hypothetical protein KVG29_10015 [Caldicoprobacter algeriensis]|uniref:hypothetical protein n=1 Tax=Caldicoprobacter algeriensis TaxID=699281 RepID=UPI0020799165|nr:hypothetical protein [Caldicoprobacter algeriensis]MCM8901554.1 hypothetical protein [Caldicoprobacter algeriensis]
MDEPDVRKMLADLAGWKKQRGNMFYKKYLELIDKNLRYKRNKVIKEIMDPPLV